jgi:hypothetical protein
MTVETLVTGPGAIDAVLVLMGLEAAWYAAFRRRGHSLPGGLGATLAAGGFLLLALRAALAGAAWGWVAAFLGAALAAHLVDLTWRIRSATVSVGEPPAAGRSVAQAALVGPAGRWGERA